MKARIGGREVVVDEGKVRGGSMRGGDGSAKACTASRSVSNPAPAPLSFTLLGQITSGKNSIKTTRTGRRYPTKRFVVWRDEAETQLRKHLLALVFRWAIILPKPMRVKLVVQYYPGDLIRRDVPGMLDAICHVLEIAGIVEDDAQIKAVDWQEMDLDRERPRVLLTLSRQASGG